MDTLSGLAPSRRQAITLSNVEPVPWPTYASPVLSMLNFIDNLRN